MSIKPRHRLAVAVVLVAVVVAVPALALALGTTKTANENPLQGISAATTALSGESIVDSRSIATLVALNEKGAGNPEMGSQLIDQARLMPVAITGHRLYLIPTAGGSLCTFLEGDIEACGAPLSDANPALVVAVDDDGPGGVGPTVFGLAQDGIASVTLDVSGRRHVAPVNRNVFQFQAGPSVRATDIVGTVATKSDGTTLNIR